MLRQTERLARAGYLALMPDLFADGGARRCLVPTMRAATSGRGRAWADLEAARQTLAEHPDCTGRVGVIGFCMGGSFALVAAGRGAFDAASVNYGLLPEDAERALAESCPVVASYGGRDRMLKGAAARLESVLEGAGVPHDVKEYPGAGHSFLNDAENAPRLLRPPHPDLRDRARNRNPPPTPGAGSRSSSPSTWPARDHLARRAAPEAQAPRGLQALGQDARGCGPGPARTAATAACLVSERRRGLRSAASPNAFGVISAVPHRSATPRAVPC
ncbi:dienelactone hydrolase family protein [Streptomyces sp. NBC_00310]|uniref:dienelactone hydrolase family protein n=1 Tax=Streptomyces sp. NBC_00310 TaxID=2903645 RepID=UPI002E1B73A2